MKPLHDDPDFQQMHSAIWQPTWHEPTALPLTQKHGIGLRKRLLFSIF